MLLDDINNYWKNPLYFQLEDSTGQHVPVTVVTENGDLKKADAKVYRFQIMQDIFLCKRYFFAGQQMLVLKVDYLSEYKFLPLINHIQAYGLDVDSNPSTYWSTSAVLANNISNAPLVDKSLFYLDTCLLVGNVGGDN